MRHDLFTYRNDLKEKAKALRKQGILSEVLLWKRISKKQLKGLAFHRQKPILDYIIDFYCPELKLAVEIDGGSHYESEIYDQRRDARLKIVGIHTIHIADSRVKRNIQGVLDEIVEWIDANRSTKGRL